MTTVRMFLGLLTTSLALVLTGCGAGSTVPPPLPVPGIATSSLTVTSKSFASRATIPVENTCDGADKSPQLTWSAPPEGTKSLAVVVEDPDMPSGAFVHWVVFNLAPETTSIAEGVDPSSLGARVGINDFKNVRYAGPCPPHHELHRYVFRVFALDIVLGLNDGADRAALYATITRHVLAEGFSVATFSR
jgi:Raf kinase inhibitor-like YbhB/YbcL family protein